MTVLQAILIGVVYYLGSAPWAIGYLTVCKPLVAARWGSAASSARLRRARSWARPSS